MKLYIKGFRIFKDGIEIDLKKNLTALIGERKSGKTSILDALKFLAQNRYNDSLINNDSNEAVVVLKLNNGRIEKRLKVSKTGGFNATLKAEINGKKLKQSDVSKLFNPIQLDQNHFRNMNTGDKAAFLLEVLEIDTNDLDNKYSETEKEAKKYRDAVAAFGEIDTTEVEDPKIEIIEQQIVAENEKLSLIREKNIADNNEKKQAAEIAYAGKLKLWQESEADARSRIADFNNLQQQRRNDIFNANKALEFIQQGNDFIRSTFEDIDTELYEKNISECIDELPRPAKKKTFEPTDPPTKEPLNLPPAEPDNTKLNELIEKKQAAKIQKIYFEQYLERLKKQEKKDELYALQLEKEAEQRSIKKQKAAKLAEKNGIIESLEFTEKGSFIFDDTKAAGLSDSQIELLTSKISGLFKNAIPIILVDGGEKFGKYALPEYSEYCKKSGNDVLMSVVGQRPAEVPENAQIYVIEDGKILK